MYFGYVMSNSFFSELGKTDIFQAVGVVVGEVFFQESFVFVKIDKRDYRVKYKNIAVIRQLKKNVEKFGQGQKLVVYPIFTHFPGSKDWEMSFDLIGFRSLRSITNKNAKNAEDIDNKLNQNEFKISGIWQYIPVCRTPCISVFRNSSPELNQKVAKLNPIEKSIVTKANHIPIYCSRYDIPVEPYRYIKPRENEKKQEYKPFFVSIKAKFNPETGVFNFVELLSETTNKIPHYFKLSKEDKMIALRARLEKKGKKNAHEFGKKTEKIKPIKKIISVQNKPKKLPMPVTKKKQIANS